MERIKKEEQVNKLQSIFKNMKSGILIDYRGIKVNQLVELRKKLNEKSSNLKVVKNSLARLAAKDTPISDLSERFSETRALIYNDSEPVGQAKILVREAEDSANLKILAGILVSDGKSKILTTEEVEALSKLPSREELLVKFLFLLKAPANQFVRTLNAVPSKFVRILASIRDKK